MMNDSINVPPTDAVRSFLQFVEFMRSPAEVEKLSKRLLQAMTDHEASQKKLQAAMVALDDHKREVETATAVLQRQADDKIAADSADYDKRVAQREVELSAREKRASDLLAKATADAEASAKMRAKLDEKMRLLSA